MSGYQGLLKASREQRTNPGRSALDDVSGYQGLLEASKFKHNTLAPQPAATSTLEVTPPPDPLASPLSQVILPKPVAAAPIQMQEVPFEPETPQQRNILFNRLGTVHPPVEPEPVPVKQPNFVPDDDGFIINLDNPMLPNADGSNSTENTITVSGEDLGFTGPSKNRTRFFNIPTIWDGQKRMDGEAIALARQHLIDGKYPFPNYSFRDEADEAAYKRSLRIRYHRDPDRSAGAAFMFGTKNMLSSTKRYVADVFENLSKSRTRPGEQLNTEAYEEIRKAADALEMENLEGGFKPMSFREIEEWQDLTTYISTTIAQSAPYMATSLITAGTASPIMMAGETHSHLEEIKGLSQADRVRYSTVGGVIAGALELAGLGFIVKGIPRELISRYGVKGLARLAGKTNPETAKEILQRVSVDAIAAAGAESLTEMGQETTFMAMEGWAGRDIPSEERFLRLSEAGVGGFTAGKVLGAGASGTKVGIQQLDQQYQENQQDALEQQMLGDILNQQAFQSATEATLPPPTVTQLEPPTVERPDAKLPDDPSTIDAAPVELPEIDPQPVRPGEIPAPRTTELEGPTIEAPTGRIEPEQPEAGEVEIPVADEPEPPKVEVSDEPQFKALGLDKSGNTIGVTGLEGLELDNVPESPKDPNFKSLREYMKTVVEFKKTTVTPIPGTFVGNDTYIKITKDKKSIKVQAFKTKDTKIATEFPLVVYDKAVPKERIVDDLTLFLLKNDGLADSFKKRAAPPIEQPETKIPPVKPPEIKAKPGQPIFRAWLENETAPEDAAPQFTPAVLGRSGKDELIPMFSNPDIPELNNKPKLVKPPNSDLELEANPTIVDLSDLKQAEGDLQIRDRSRLESDQGVRDRAQNLDVPQITEFSRTSDTGMPIITPDGTIISGNGRVLTLKAVYQDPAFDKQRMDYQGTMDSIAINNDYDEPILVRVLTGQTSDQKTVTPEILKNFATASNEATVSALSATEQAKRDAAALDQKTLDLYKGDRLTNLENAMFISAFDKRVIPKSEQGKFYNEGKLTIEGEKRIQNAILAKAYDDATALERMLESSGENNVKALSEGLRDAAPAFAKLKDADNITDQMKLIPQKIVDAVNKISELRNDKTIPNPVKEYFNQGALFQDDVDPIRDSFISLFYNDEKTRPKSKEYINDAIRFLVDEVMGQVPGGLPGLENAVEPGTVIDIAKRKAAEKEDARRERRNAKKQRSLPGINEGSGEGDNQIGKQAQRPERKKDSKKAKRDSGPGLDADTKTRGEPEVSGRDSGTRAKDESNLPPKGMRTGTVHKKESSNPRISYFRQAFTDAGFDNWQEAENLPPKEKRRILDKLVREKFGIPFIQTSPDNKAMADDLDNLLDAYRQLQVMAHTLQLPNSAIGLDGTLGLALPGKDWGGYYAAFYNSGRGEIGPVQTKSDLPLMQPPFIIMPGRSTSFGHEWGHALDYHILENLGTDWARGMSARIRKLKDDDQAWEKEVHQADDPQLRELQLAFGEVMNTLFFDMDDVASQIMYLEHQIARKEAYHVRSGEKLGVNESKLLKKDKRQLKEILDGSSNKQIKESRIRDRVKEFSKAPYWQRPTEMFARAFETYLAHLVTKANFSTEFITSTDAAYQLTLEQAKDADVRFPLTHPQEEDRLQVFMAFDRLFAAIQASPDLLEGEAAPAPGDYDIIDMRQYFTGERAFSVFDRKAWKEKNAEDKRKIQAARNRLKAEKMRPVRFSDRPWFEQQQIKLQDDFLYPVLRSKTATMLGIRDRYKNDRVVKAAMEDLISRLVTEPGASVSTFKEGVFSEATQMEVRRFAHAYKKIINDPKNLLDGLTAKQTEDLRLLMTSDPDTLKKMLKKDLDPKMVRGAGYLRTLLTNVYRYLKRNDVNINFLAENNYLPRILDNPLVFAYPYKFIYGDKEQRGAKPLYKEVLWVNDYGIFDNSADQIVDIASIKKFPYSQLIEDDDSPVKILSEVAFTIRQSYLDIATAKADLDKLSDLKETDPEKYVSEKARLEDKIKDAQDRIDEALDLNEEALAEAYEQVSDLWAELGSTDWLLRIQQMAGEDPNAHSPMGRFTKSRFLPAEADTYMVDFYMEPIEAISNYITAAVRKAEYNKRFGPQLVPKNHKIFKQTGQKRSYLDYLFQVKMAGRMDPADIEQIRMTVELLTGTQGHFRDSGFQKFLNIVHATGTMALLPRAAISSIAEPMTVGITAESSIKGIEAFALSVEEALAMVSNKADQRVRLRKQMAEILGVVDDPEIGEMVANRLGGTFADNPKVAARMSTYFRRTLLQGLTNAQRRSSMRIGIKYIQELSQEYLEIKEKNLKQGTAMDNLIDFGVPESDMEQFATFMTQFDTRMPDVDQLQEKDGDLTDMGRIMALAVGRFTNRSIQDPNSMDRPRYAEHPMGRIVYGIMSFSYSFGRNVLVASYKKTKREYEKRGLTSASLMAAKLGGAMFSLYLSHTLVNAVRERLTNEERWKEKKAEGTLGRYLAEMGLYRSGVTGAFDPLFQATRSLKYQVDLSNLLIGAGPTYFARAIERIVKASYWETNSEKTPAAEYQALIALWELVVIPMTAWHVAANPLFGTGLGLSRHFIAGFAPAWLSAPDMKFMFAHETLKFLTGESYTPKKGRQAKKKKKDKKRIRY